MEEGRGVYRVLVGRPEGKRPLERPRHRWVDNIKIGPLGDRDRWDELDSAGSGWDQGRISVNTVDNLRFHKKDMEFIDQMC
jgi:hypothetical protein